jgi:hypothetical protein
LVAVFQRSTAVATSLDPGKPGSTPENTGSFKD